MSGSNEGARCVDPDLDPRASSVAVRVARLLDRANLLAAVRAGDFGHSSLLSRNSFDPFVARCEVVLLADAGDADEVESLLGRLAAHSVGAGFDVEMVRNHDAELAAWARTRLAAAES